jgi:hypothetical protein
MSSNGRVWLAPLPFRVFFGLASLALAAGAVLPWDGLASYWHDLGLRLSLLAESVFLVTLTYRARMELDEEQLVLRYTLTTRVIPLHTIVSVTPGRAGLQFQTRDGASYGSPAFIGEKAPLMSWLHRRTKADSIAETILAARP